MNAPHTTLWIGGPPCAGKTTVARLLTRRHGLRWYNAAARTRARRDRAVDAGHAAAVRWERLSSEARWPASPDELLAERGLPAGTAAAVEALFADALAAGPVAQAVADGLPVLAPGHRLEAPATDAGTEVRDHG